MTTSGWLEKLKINGKLLKAQLDTGTKYNVFSVKTYSTLDVKSPIRPTNSKLKEYTGHDIEIKGMTTLQCQHTDTIYPLQFYTATRDGSTIISAQACKQLQLIRRVNTVSKDVPASKQSTDTSASPKILEEYPDVYKGLGCVLLNIQSKCLRD